MTAAELAAAKAAFLAKGGTVTAAPTGIAYGVSPEADKAKRAVEKAAVRAKVQYGYSSEHGFERQAEAIREAYHTGGRHAAIDAMNSRR